MEKDIYTRYAELIDEKHVLEEKIDYLLAILDESQYQAYKKFCNSL